MQKLNPIQNIIKALLFAITSFGYGNVQAQNKTNQPHEYIFSSYTAANGLASSEILTLAVDEKGFLWAGTNAGLSRYDGYTFTNITYSADKHLIGMVNIIKTDSMGKLWIGASSGLYCYWQNRLIKISTDKNTPQSVNDIISETDGSLWVTTENGPAYITAADIGLTGTKKIILQNFILPLWNEKFSARFGPQTQLIKKAPDGTVYFSNQYQLFRFASGNINLIHTASEENDKIEYILPISKTKLFYNATATGLHKIQNGIDTLFKFNNIYQPDRKPVAAGHWFVGSLGLVCFHPDEEFISESVAFRDAGAQWLTTVLKQNNFLWIASHSGLVKAKLSAFHLYKKAVYNDVQESFSFCELKNEKFLVGVNHGIIYELKEEGLTDFLPANLQPVKYAEIKAMHQDERGWLWMGTGYQGIALNRNGKTFRFTEERDKLHDNSFYSFVATSQGKLFAIGDKGMTEIMLDEKENISFRPIYSLPDITKYAKFYSGIEAPDGIVWIAGEEGIRFLKDDSLHKFSLFEKNISIRSIKIAKDNSVWVATEGNGIVCCRFNANNKLEVVKQYDEKDGLNSLQFLDVMIDKEDNVWAGSIKGLTFIGRNGKNKGLLLNFTEADGFIKPGYYAMKIYQDKKGKIWAGTSLGICSFMPEDLFLTPSPPTIYLMGIDFLKQNNTILNSDSLIFNNHEHNLSLPYKNNSINFNYTAINFSGPEAIQYYYRMQGLDSNWIAAGSRRSIPFYNLPAGKYIFSVKAVNEKAEWSDGTTEFVFVIHPPFWQTLWFRLMVILLISGFVIWMVRQRINSIKRKATTRQQITELEVKALRAQMNPHFLFNAMNSIQQFTLKNDMDNANLYLSKFSTLLRKVLHSSQQNYISLEEEIEQLQLYLSIESLRMDPGFSYTVAADAEIETDALKIPGMLLQPFVENALKHGLALKEGEKKLDIEFQLTTENILTVSITDNGIGREKAGLLKKQQEKLLPHQSEGIHLVEERLRLLSQVPAAEKAITITDLLDASGNALGTRVDIELPVLTG